MAEVGVRKKNRPDKNPGDSFCSDPDGIRTHVAAVKGRCPGPLDDGACCSADANYSLPRKGREYADVFGPVNRHS